jgi:hypothetical protein
MATDHHILRNYVTLKLCILSEGNHPSRPGNALYIYIYIADKSETVLGINRTEVTERLT